MTYVKAAPALPSQSVPASWSEIAVPSNPFSSIFEYAAVVGALTPHTGYVSTAAMERVLEEKIRLCDMLEEIADSLPDNIDKARCLQISSVLVPVVRSTHRYEEDVIFPAYTSVLADDAMQSPLQRLRSEHFEDECYADELTEALLAVARGQDIGNAEALGYMLRAFFESVRRHVAFEREHVLPTIKAAYR